MGAASDTQFAERLRGDCLQLILGSAQIANDSAHRLVIKLSRLGKLNIPGGALQQTRPEPLLQRFYPPADRCSGGIETRRRG
jgi:hypothetical protein